MKLYKIVALNTSQGAQPDSETHWVGSLGDAAAKRKQLGAEGWSRKEVETFTVEYPTDKVGLLAFLNAGA